MEEMSCIIADRELGETCDFFILKVLNETKEQQYKESSYPKDAFAIGELMILAPRARGLSFITRLLGGNDANAKAAKGIHYKVHPKHLGYSKR